MKKALSLVLACVATLAMLTSFANVLFEGDSINIAPVPELVLLERDAEAAIYNGGTVVGDNGVLYDVIYYDMDNPYMNVALYPRITSAYNENIQVSNYGIDMVEFRKALNRTNDDSYKISDEVMISTGGVGYGGYMPSNPLSNFQDEYTIRLGYGGSSSESSPEYIIYYPGLGYMIDGELFKTR